MSLLASCTDPSVVAEVGSEKITRAQVVEGRSGQPSRQRLEALLPRALLAESARRSGLDQDPAVAARVGASRREILAQAYLEQQLGSATDEVALRKLYEERKGSLEKTQIHVRHIVVFVSGGEADAALEAQRKINELYAQLAGEADFESLARERSDDRVSGPKGGDLGPLLEGQVDPAFFKVAAKVPKGAVSKPFATASGYHLVQAIEDPRKVVPTFEEAKSRLAAEARHEAQTKLLEKLRAQVKVRIHEDKFGSEQK